MKTHPSALRTREAAEKIRPTYAYIVIHGDNLYHFTNADVDLSMTNLPATHGLEPQTFTACQAKHSPIKQESEINAGEVQMDIGVNSSSFATSVKSYILQTVPDPITVIIARLNPLVIATGTVDWNTDAYVVFKGVVTNVTFNRYVIQLNLISQIMQNNGMIPRYFWQKTCQHILYGTACGVDPDQTAFRIATVTTAIDSRERSIDIAELTLDGEAIDNEMFQGGLFYLMSGSTVITKVRIDGTLVLPASAGVRFYIGWWHNDIEVGSSIKVFRGCSRTSTQCEDVFNNLAKFGGMPYIPNINPTINGIPS